MSFDLITIGEAVLDNYIMIDNATVHCDIKHENCLLCLNYAEKIPINTTVQAVGGNAANVAAGCKLLNFNSALVGEIGDDINGQIVVSELKKNWY